ncbi:MT-A70-domain-containing protein [Hypoxylon trugodes]|uniref:MT-A70-domain-containing protein n=1 Tax=Hypoxylon trugodes TaxID=326681 RepID=UPI00219CE3D1|nr:MT-A70-domain-containing protein [Hypoxylon trugodes]KAI1386376.1 MT-A70-domain-containing protein [Hypoxylon trugodes]
MHSEKALPHLSASCILFENPDKSIILIDIPRSIEEAQLLPEQAIKRRIISSRPAEVPWKTPEPKKGLGQSVSPSAAISELMTIESVKAALQEIKHSYEGPWCLQRVLSNTGEASDDELHHEESRKRKQTSSNIKDVHTTSEPYIPDLSHYLLGTIESQRGNFLTDAPKFDLIVLDPPWPSRSVKRKRNSYTIAYDMQDVRNLLNQIPVSSHLKSDGLVAVWVTNKAAVADLLTSYCGIFSEWGLEFVGEWIWLKITNSGDPIMDIEAQWRKPWERLLIGRRKGSTSKQSIPTKVVMGVPDIHSRKPNLRPLFQDMLPENYNGLEIFARNLTTGWWSWGNEVLLFQQKEHWIETANNE